MQREFTEDSQKPHQDINPDPFSQPSAQYGLYSPESGAIGTRVELGVSNRTPALDGATEDVSDDPSFGHMLDGGQLDEKLRSLNVEVLTVATFSTPGQRVSEYENALISTSGRLPLQPPGFKVMKRASAASSGVQLPDFPNEVLIQILSHLHPDSHGNVALVSKRFYALITTPYAWRAAFLRTFPGKEALSTNITSDSDNRTADRVQGEFRSFTRLTPLASWRSEYLQRLRLLRSLSRGRPGTGLKLEGSSRAATSGKKTSAVLTYYSKLPWVTSHVHAVFANTKKGPRAIHGSAELGLVSVSDPSLGKVEKWGLDDPFSASQLQEVVPDLEYYGLGDGPAACPNVMDVSQPYGFVSGEGFPGGRAYYRGTDELRGRYLGPASTIIDMTPEIPKIPELSEAVCAIWISKSSSVPSLTQSMIGIMTGSTLGVVTTYALGCDALGSKYSTGEITARWVLSPGVPIIALRVDDNFSLRRKSLKRVWAVALNALGEVFYLTETPTPAAKGKAGEGVRDAWLAGRTVYWELIESTRRIARPNESGKNVLRGAYSPRSPSNSMNLSKEQMMAEAQEIEKFLRYKPSHFRNVCEGWDMRRKLEVDFAAGGDNDGTGESIFVITCGHKDAKRAGVYRLTRHCAAAKTKENLLTPYIELQPLRSSLFGGITPPSSGVSSPQVAREISILTSSPPQSTPRLGPSLPKEDIIEEWQQTKFGFKNHGAAEITSSALDLTNFAVLAPFEDPLETALGAPVVQADSVPTPTSKNSSGPGEIPGRRSRILAIGTSKGVVIAWNAREKSTTDVVDPIRVIQTESPSISCVAISALYLVHGGSDGLVQAWDTLASTLDPIRTLNAKFGRVPTHIQHAAPLAQRAGISAVGAIFLDPDPAMLRGVLSCGLWLRFWSYSSTNQAPCRKRRLRHSDIHGRLASRRQFGTVSSHIRAEVAELRHEQAEHTREQARLRNRFGVGLGDLTEEEAIRYAKMISEESLVAEEQRRLSASDTGSAADNGETWSSTGSFSGDTVSPEPSIPGASMLQLPPLQEESDDNYEAQMQRAIRLSLMESANDLDQSPRENGSGDFEFQVKVKGDKKKGKGTGKRSSSSSTLDSPVRTPVVQSGARSAAFSSSPGANLDEDLELALQLSMVEERERQNRLATLNSEIGLGIHGEEYPLLETKGKGKGKGV